VRGPKNGGYGTVLERAVRDAPIAVTATDVYYLEEDQPTLRRVATNGGGSSIVARGRELERVTAMAADASGVFVGTERMSTSDRRSRRQGAVLAMAMIAR
jgi:hypothetical protein